MSHGSNLVTTKTLPELRSNVSVLYCDPRGPYPRLVADWWDARRDARLYAGPNPIVCHPPCGAWCKLRHLYQGNDADLAPLAVEQVRRFGGCLEHPAESLLWAHCSLPGPWELPDAFGGRTIEVDQVDFGHVARKKTWVYCVGVEFAGVQFPPPGSPTHWCSGFRSSTGPMPSTYKRTGCAVPPGIKVCSAQQRRRTPIAFAEWLLDLAATATPPTRAEKER